ncbi:MAG: flagellar export chaperone FlgN [Syntrophales bacterium LBB04]|nr:flagellar export chaperone FlgN [Syntrophales bacterium LBB04]
MIPEDAFHQLKRIALIETEAWEGLEQSLRMEMQAPRRQDLSAISQSTMQKEMAINGVRVAVNSRRKLLTEIHPRLGLKPPVLLENVFRLADERQRQEMSAWQARFAVYGDNVNTLNKKNIDAIKAAIAVVSDSLQFLTNITHPTSGYTAGGSISAHPLQGRLVSKRG